MSLAKIPFIVVGTWFAYVSGTAPYPAVPDKELRILKARFVKPIAAVYKLAVLTNGILETTLILLSYLSSLPSSPLSSSSTSRIITKASHLHASPLYLISFVFVLIFTHLRRICFTTLGRYFTFDLAILKDHRLITSGPYSIIRHPGYTGAIFSNFGLAGWQLARGSLWDVYGRDAIARGGIGAVVCAMVMGVWLMVTVVFPISLMRRARVEDEMLKEAFPVEFEKWKKETPYLLIPGVY